jgi:hypothetical protein
MTIMMDPEDITLVDETPEADAVEQHLAADVEEEPVLDTAYIDDMSDRDANEADLIDQAIVVSPPDRDWHLDY